MTGLSIELAGCTESKQQQDPVTSDTLNQAAKSLKDN